MSRAYTPEEVREMFLDNINEIIDDWANVDNPERTLRQKLEGVAFSILTMIDGCRIDMPIFNLVASPHPSDKEYHMDERRNWIEPGTVINGNCLLHEEWK